MSLSEIRRLSNEAAQEAAEENKQPYVPFDEAEIMGPKFFIPNLGDHRPEGWKLVEELFCDKSGFGAPGEAALTIKQFREKVLEYYKTKKSYGYGMIEEGQFQCYVGVFERLKAK
jgi:hypothetical protein